jgi:DNA (cytosine-5)-methyltransferase 1
MRTVLVSGFAGVGGFDRAGEMIGWETAVLCEIDPECQVVLRYHFPGAYIHSDIRTLTGKIIDEEIRKRYGDEPIRVVWCSGFPCQPFSSAGKREGTDDDRYLWPEVARILGEYRFDAIVLENVFGLTSILESPVYADLEGQAAHAIRSCETGLFNEPAKREKVEISFEVVQQRIMGRILEDIREAGYECPAARDGSPVVLCVPACAVGAPHRRDRVWFVANRNRPHRNPDKRREHKVEEREVPRKEQGSDTAGAGEQGAVVAHSKGVGHDIGEGAGGDGGREGIEDQPIEDAAVRGKLGGLGQLPAVADPGHQQPQGRQSAESRLQPHRGGKAWGIAASLGGARVAANPEITKCECPINPRGRGDGLADDDSLEDETVPFASDPDGFGLRGQGDGQGVARLSGEEGEGGFWADFPTEWPLRDGDDGVSARLGGVRVPGTGKRVTASSLNKFTLKAGGNAIVPQVALSIFRALASTWED